MYSIDRLSSTRLQEEGDDTSDTSKGTDSDASTGTGVGNWG
jgi:hypothetical protein